MNDTTRDAAAASQLDVEGFRRRGVDIVSRRAGGRAAAAGWSVVDVDRSNPVLGNRHVLRDHRDANERARVIAAYKADLDADMARNGPMARAVADLAARVREGEKLALRCWCAPRPCHAEHIAHAIMAQACD